MAELANFVGSIQGCRVQRSGEAFLPEHRTPACPSRPAGIADSAAGAGNVARRSSAFTLIELMVVMGIILVIMGVAVPLMNIGGGTALRTTVSNFRSTVALTRQWAITHRTPTTIVIGSTNVFGGVNKSFYVVTNSSDGLVNDIKYLPDSVQFTNLPPGLTRVGITFRPDGTVAGSVTAPERKFRIQSTAGATTTFEVRILALTGAVKVREIRMQQ